MWGFGNGVSLGCRVLVSIRPARNTRRGDNGGLALPLQRGDEPVLQDRPHDGLWRVNRDVGVVGSCFQVNGGNPVGMVSVPALQALKFVAHPIALIDKQTGWTHLRRVRRIDLLVMETFHQRQKIQPFFQRASHPVGHQARHFLRFCLATNIQVFRDED